MSTWTTISNALVAVGAKPFATTIQALRDNPIAIAIGAAGAPRIRLAAIEPLSAGNTVVSRNDGTVGTASTDFVTVVSWAFLQAGTVRVTLEHRNTGGSLPAESRIVRIRNGATTVIQTWSTTSTGFTARSVDVGIQPGDEIAVQHRHTAGFNTSETRNTRLQSSGEKWWPSVGARWE